MTVQTSLIPGASTTANVALILRLGSEAPQHLELARDESDFARGKEQSFEVVASGQGVLGQVALGHDNFGALPSSRVCLLVGLLALRVCLLPLFAFSPFFPCLPSYPPCSSPSSCVSCLHALCVVPPSRLFFT